MDAYWRAANYLSVGQIYKIAVAPGTRVTGEN
jgi:phosphoketolase